VPEQLGLRRRAVAVKNTRNITKRDMVHNDYLPVMEVGSQTYEVRADGMLLICEPGRVLPLAQRHFFVLRTREKGKMGYAALHPSYGSLPNDHRTDQLARGAGQRSR
jgi:hypothetical protein